ncbi:MAG: cupin domain-containing protein [Calditrichaceae bacterium]|jgi:quercetin dioxygenase-like cupin family protein
MPVKHSKQITSEDVPAGNKTSRQVLISSDEAPNFAMRKFILQPGGSMPNHTNTVEHEQYVLNGQAEIAIGDKTYQVKKDDVVFIPANVPHWYKVIGDEPFEFLCLIPNQKDEIILIK